jgi:hypothetical protein
VAMLDIPTAITNAGPIIAARHRPLSILRSFT